MPPPGIGPRRLHASQLRSSQRPSSPGTQLQDTRRTGRPGRHPRVAMATRSRPHTLLLVFDSSFSHAIHECLGSVWVRLKGFRQESWPNDPCVKETKVTVASRRRRDNGRMSVIILCSNAKRGHTNTHAGGKTRFATRKYQSSEDY